MKNKMTTILDTENQRGLLNRCVSEEIVLTEKLSSIGLEYDDMRYASNFELKIPTTKIEWTDDIERTPNNIPAISFFAGAGGFDIGFYLAGYENLASVEINKVFCETLKHNFPTKLVIGPPDYSGDVQERQAIAQVLIEKLGLEAPFEGVFHGGPPCQPFSIASNQRFSKNGENFKRTGFDDKEKGNLLFDYIWFITKFRPRVFIIENVAGFMELDKGKQLSKACEIFKEAGYMLTDPQVHNLADYGVPQARQRFVMVGSRTGHFVFPEKSKQHTPCAEVFTKSLNGVKNHETRLHKAESIMRYMELEYGKRDKLGRVDRLNPAQPAKTVIAGGTKGGGRSHLHPYIPRTLSVRESARLQTFPDWYEFKGAIARQFTQVGNAVPPLFAYKLAVAIKQQFFGNSQHQTGPTNVAQQLEMAL
ncbi:MAG: DNA cytosine methyltransferase [Saprospiraceae bacterium]|nr:DNA cytosine methyltransferase [Saprospiraceae bacterium]MCF8249869.1 DNA cytosine methyltransferase [Saprospiraceae bacterium]MCF8279461.1 DNA cytosine methyltransferase [Bacteroidales bacterium]MCF8311697.1 DNA cytosine methyltransferase [Saprospiraceae bacterium]MCF8440264.1 DNA cytosine methyltransferase [Saprospiraceae bacterium]